MTQFFRGLDTAGQFAVRCGILIAIAGALLLSPLTVGIGAGTLCLGTYLTMFAQFKSL